VTLDGVLGRPEHAFPAPDVAGERILVTGSSGSIGTRVCDRLRELGAVVRSFDIAEGLDVTSIQLCEYVLGDFKPAYVVHLAAHKYATTAEAIPYEVANLNIHGTHYVCSRAAEHGVRNVIVASTCKAIEPETVYGASKLVAERIAMNFGYTVGRFFNVIDSAGNVFEIWRERMAEDLPLLVTPCRRYFISGREAVDYILHLLGRPAGKRYAPFPGSPVMMEQVVETFAPGYPVQRIGPRRGDRVAEPLHGAHESFELVDGMLMVISGPHDEPAEDSSGATPAMVGLPAGSRFDP
jgi:UDP-N-acetylglucosamine 4,6-dehydratase/5-epimerase